MKLMTKQDILETLDVDKNQKITIDDALVVVRRDAEKALAFGAIFGFVIAVILMSAACLIF